MKTMLILFALVNSTQIFAQGYFPLHKGNLWQYQSNDLQSPSRWETLILGDTLLPNGRTYAQFNQTNFGTRFLRQDGLQVFGYSQTDTTEFLLFDFGARPGDTLTRFPDQQRRIVLNSVYPSGYLGHTSWVFVMLAGTGGGTYDFVDWWITDSLGLTYMIGEPGISYNVTGMRIDGVTYGTILDIQDPQPSIPGTTCLRPNYPNPFNPTTTISFDLARAGEVTIKILNILGEEVSTIARQHFSAGLHSLIWNASGMPSGCYLCRMTTSDYSATQRVLLLR